MTTTINSVATDANSLFAALASDVALPTLPDLVIDPSTLVPDTTVLPTIAPVVLPDLTTATVDGTGVFDVLMKAASEHLDAQFIKNRITGAEYAKVYLGMLTAVMQFGTQFLLGKDQATWQSLQAQASVRLANAQIVKANGEIMLTQVQIQSAQLENAELFLKAYIAKNQAASSKMALVEGYNGILDSESKIKLTAEQYQTQRAQTLGTRDDGVAVAGLLGAEISLKNAQVLTQNEELDAARAQTKNTLKDGTAVSGILAIDKTLRTAQANLTTEQYEATRAQTRDTHGDGSAIGGLLALEKQIKAETYEAARAQVRDTLSTGGAFAGLVALDKLIKTAQMNLTTEQMETQRGQTKDTLLNGTPITGILAKEKALKDAQSKLVLEQFETQRAQTRGTLSDASVVSGMVGAQTALYNQQVISYKRDAESKAVKMLLDTWVARKTIDEGVAVPANIDTPAINTHIATYFANIGV